MDRAVETPSHGKKQMLVLAEIDHRANVERRINIRKIGFICGLVINFHADSHIRQNLFLQQPADKSPIAAPGK